MRELPTAMQGLGRGRIGKILARAAGKLSHNTVGGERFVSLSSLTLSVTLSFIDCSKARSYFRSIC